MRQGGYWVIAMLTGHYFEYLCEGRPDFVRVGRSDAKQLVELLSRSVCTPFALQSGVDVLVIPLVGTDGSGADDSYPIPAHPTCAEFAGGEYCGESWRLHLAELESGPRTHWHKCDYGMLCAVVPLVCSDSCIAAVKLVCPPETPADRFDACVTVLDALVRDFVIGNAEFLSREMRAELEAKDANAPPDLPTEGANNHERLRKAIEYIEAQLADPRLSVAKVARHLDIHPDYLSNCFVRQTGQRMTFYISARRTERAKNLLITTRWPLKRVASECGFANRNWFSHVFATHAGMTPGRYRAAHSRQATAPSTEILNSILIS